MTDFCCRMLYNRCSAFRSKLLTDFVAELSFLLFCWPARSPINFLFVRLAACEQWKLDVERCENGYILRVANNWTRGLKLWTLVQNSVAALFTANKRLARLNLNNLQLMVAKLCKRSQVIATSPAHLTITETFDGAVSWTERTFDMLSFTFRSLTFLHFF